MGSPALPAQLDIVCYLHSCDGDAALLLPRNGASLLEAGKSSGISMRPGRVGFMVQIQAHIYLVHDFSASLYHLHNYLVGLDLCTQQE